MLTLRYFDDVQTYQNHVLPFLVQREAENNLLIGLLQRLLDDPTRYAGHYLVTVENQVGIVAAAIRTLPLKLIFAHVTDPDALALIGEDCYQRFQTLPGAMASAPIGEQFAQLWQAKTGLGYQIEPLRVFELTQVRPVTEVAGHLRPATPADDALLMEWVIGFQSDAFGHIIPSAEAERTIAGYRRIPGDGIMVWEVDGEPVTMAGHNGRTPNGIRINLVYTPPEKRRRGYASACVAALSQHLLDQGLKFCFLFTDANNPTSNHIYQTIGYEWVADIQEIAFGSVP